METAVSFWGNLISAWFWILGLCLKENLFGSCQIVILGLTSLKYGFFEHWCKPNGSSVTWSHDTILILDIVFVLIIMQYYFMSSQWSDMVVHMFQPSLVIHKDKDVYQKIHVTGRWIQITMCEGFVHSEILHRC